MSSGLLVHCKNRIPYHGAGHMRDQGLAQGPRRKGYS